jgi:hypothetical protein
MARQRLMQLLAEGAQKHPNLQQAVAHAPGMLLLEHHYSPKAITNGLNRRSVQLPAQVL